jgi:hypothetical protein
MRAAFKTILAVGLATVLGISSAKAADTPEYLLASIDAGSPNVPDATIASYARYLDALEPKCTEPRMRIADFVVVGVREVQDRTGRHMTHLSFLQALNESIPTSIAKQGGTNCAEIAAALVLLIK